MWMRVQANIVRMPLQLENARWRPADGNWFFDFRRRRRKPSVFSNSRIFTRVHRRVRFRCDFIHADDIRRRDRHLAQVVSDLLSITGR